MEHVIIFSRPGVVPDGEKAGGDCSELDGKAIRQLTRNNEQVTMTCCAQLSGAFPVLSQFLLLTEG